MNEKLYSIWLMPNKSTGKEFSEVIRYLSDRYQTSVFEPHVTLAGAVKGAEQSLINFTRKLADGRMTLRHHVDGIEQTDKFYRALYARINLTTELQELYKQAATFFPELNSQNFLPHLSLMYSESVSREEKKDLTAELDFVTVFDLTLSKLRLQLTDGSVSTWKKIAEFNLRKND